MIVHVDDCLIFGLNENVVNDFLKSLKRPKPGEEYPYEDRGFDFTDIRDANTFLGVTVKKEEDMIKMMQLLLIERILDALDFSKVTINSKLIPSTYILYKVKNGEVRKDCWNYRSLIGILNYLANVTRPDSSIAVHQCARFLSNLKLSHDKAVKRITKYLKGTKDIGIKVRVDAILGFNACVDTDFASG